MKIKFIVNPISGKGKQKDIESIIHKNLDTKKYEYSVRFTERPGHAKELCKQAITDGYDVDDKRAVADARAKLATAFKNKAKSVNEKYIVPPKTTDFAIVYAPTESLYKELTEYQDPSTKELLTQEIMKKYKVVICGPNTLSAYLQSLHMGFQSLKVQKGATEIYNHLKTITTRFGKHFDNIITLRKKLEEAMMVVDKFGTDARSINRTLENIKDPEQVEKAVQTENVEKFVERNKQLKN